MRSTSPPFGLDAVHGLKNIEITKAIPGLLCSRLNLLFFVYRNTSKAKSVETDLKCRLQPLLPIWPVVDAYTGNILHSWVLAMDEKPVEAAPGSCWPFKRQYKIRVVLATGMAMSMKWCSPTRTIDACCRLGRF